MSSASKQKKTQSSNRSFKIVHQRLSVKDVNLKKQSVLANTELTLLPLTSTGKVWKVNLNCKQCRILGITVNGQHVANYSYADATLRITPLESKKRSLEFYDACLYEAVMACDSDCVLGGGELIVRIPRDTYKDYPSTIFGTPPSIKISIDFSLEKPLGGLHFASCGPGQNSSYCHMFTYGWGNSSRLWFPCVDSQSELCPWDIAVTVPLNLVAVASGELTDQVLSMDGRKKTYYYTLTVPTAAPSIALAVGPFEIHPDPILPELTHFCLPGLLPLLKNTVSFISEIFGFYEELLSSRFPYSNCKLVFVDEAYQDISSYATFCLCSTNLLHSHRVVDGVQRTRALLAEALTRQYFGCYISSSSVFDWWLPRAIAKYVTHAAVRKMFGATKSQYQLMEAEEKVVHHEVTQNIPPLFSSVYLTSPTSTSEGCVPMATESPTTYPPSGRIITHPYLLSDTVQDVLVTRAFLMIRIVELKIGRDQLHQVFNKLLSLASNACESKDHNAWSHLLLSVPGLMKLVHTVSGKDIANLLEQWSCRCGVPRFTASYSYVRKKNIIEFQLKQEVQRGGAKFVGPLNITVQELDGFYTHTVQVEELSSTYELPCHSKIRKSKKRKVPLSCGEEVEMDLSQIDTEIPVLWVCVDPEGQWIKSIELEQSDSTWQYVLKHERNAVTQVKAARALSMHATPTTKAILMETILNKNLYYRVRLEAAEALVKVLNSLASSGVSSAAIISLYQRLYGSRTCPTILRYHDFSDIAEYEIQKGLPVYAAMTRALHGQCTKEVLQFLLDILKYSDNRLNKFTDSFHTAAVLDALAAFVTPTVSVMATLTKDISLKTLPDGIQLLLKEAVLRLNLEKVLQSHQFVVTVSCLKILRVLQKNGYLPNDASLFSDYARYGHFVSVRLTAVALLADVLQETESEIELDYLLKIAETDPMPAMRIAVLQSLSASPPFTRKKESALNTLTLVERLWKDMSELSHDARLRNAFTELYSALYGRLTPTCLPQGLGIVIDLKGKVARASLGSPGTLSDDIPIPGPTTSGLNLFQPSQTGAGSITEISKSLPSDIFDDDSVDTSPPLAKRPALEMVSMEGTTLSSLSGVSGSTEGLGSPASLLLADEGQSSKKKHKKEKTKHKKKKKHKHKEQR